MPGGPIYFFDVPVYRLPKDRYYREQEKFIDETMYTDEMQRKLYANNPNLAGQFKDYLWRKYGGCWYYNEIVGYIRLHILGSQIRGEYFGVEAKVIRRSRRRQFEYKTHKLAPEVDIPDDATDEDIFSLVKKYLDRCGEELKRRHIDTEILDSIGPYINWRGIWTGGGAS